MPNQYGDTRMGYQAQLFYGTAGSTAGTQMRNVRDIKYSLDQEYGDTTTRGDGLAPPISAEAAVAVKPQLTFTMLNRPGDTELAALLAAAATGTPVAMRYKNHSSGKGYDGDVNVKWENGAAINGVGALARGIRDGERMQSPEGAPGGCACRGNRLSKPAWGRGPPACESITGRREPRQGVRHNLSRRPPQCAEPC